jgi:DNA polymerase III subunit delta
VQVRAEQLPRKLQAGLSPLYLLSGDQPLQMREAADAIRQCAQTNGCEERLVFSAERDFDWGAVTASANALSLFAARRLLELRLPSARPGKEGGAALTQLAASAGADVLLITMPRLDQTAKRSAWYKALDAAGVCVDFWPVAPAELPKWIAQRFHAAGVRADADACAFLAQRTEGNLVTAAQSIALLTLLADDAVISVQDVARASGDSARFDSFGLVDASLEGDVARIVRIVRGMRAEGAALPPLLGTVTWMLRGVAGIARRADSGEAIAQIFSDRSLGVWRQRRVVVQRALTRHGAQQWLTFLAFAARVDKASKGLSADDPWALLEQLCLWIGGKPVFGVN